MKGETISNQVRSFKDREDSFPRVGTTETLKKTSIRVRKRDLPKRTGTGVTVMNAPIYLEKGVFKNRERVLDHQ